MPWTEVESEHNTNAEATPFKPESHLLWQALISIRPPVLIIFPYTLLHDTLHKGKLLVYVYLFNIDLFHLAVKSLKTKPLAIFSVLYPQVPSSYWTLSKCLLKE